MLTHVLMSDLFTRRAREKESWQEKPFYELSLYRRQQKVHQCDTQTAEGDTGREGVDLGRDQRLLFS